MCSKFGGSQRPGFTLPELLVLSALCALLIGLLLPVILHMRSLADRATTENNLKEVVLATIIAADANRGAIPPAYDVFPRQAKGPPLSLHVHLLPFVEQQNLYRRYLMGQTPDEEEIPTYLSPEDPSREKRRKGVQNQVGNLRIFSDKGRNTPPGQPLPALAPVEPCSTRYPASLTDGASNTIMYATRYGVCGKGGSLYAAHPNSPHAAFFGQTVAQVKAKPADVQATFLLRPELDQCLPQPLLAHSFSQQVISVGLADGSVRWIRADISPATWNAALTPNGGEVLGNDW